MPSVMCREKANLPEPYDNFWIEVVFTPQELAALPKYKPNTSNPIKVWQYDASRAAPFIKEWNVTDRQGEPVEITPEGIFSLPFDLMAAICCEVKKLISREDALRAKSRGV